MKNKYLYRYSTILLILIGFFSCKKSSVPQVTDNFLDYTIPEVPVTSNYTVGAFYYAPTVFNALITQKPAASIAAGGTGPYYYVGGSGATGGATALGFSAPASPALPVLAPSIWDAHVANAATAGIDYFIFSVRSPTLDNTNYKVDSSVVVNFLKAANSSKMNFALSYNMSTGTLGISSTLALDSSIVAAKLLGFYNDFKRLSYWMAKANYQKVNGKYLIIINNAQDLNYDMHTATGASSAPLYKQLRTNLSALGFDLYIVGMQNHWSPPERYYYRFQNCTDAMYEANMSDENGDNDRAYEFPQYCDQNFAYWKTTVESWGQEFIPCVQAAYNYQITNTASTAISTPRTADGSYYRTFTNVAKRNASKSRLIFVDSFNDFQHDTQIEPTQSYGTTYLDITRQEFKIN
jgi:hypothetical protein